MIKLKQKIFLLFILKQCIVFGIILTSFHGFSKKQDYTKQKSKEEKEFKSLGENSESLQIMSSQFEYRSSLNVVQKRLLPKRFLSELSLVGSPVMKGVTYLNTASLDVTYRFYLSNYWSVHLKYSYFLNKINKEGEDTLNYGQNPLELEYAQQQEYSLGFDWSPFYGKIAVLNKIIHFDVYLFFSGGVLKLLRLDEKNIPTASVGGGLVFWLSQRVSARIGLSGSYYSYEVGKKLDVINNYLSKGHVSIGVLF